MQSVWSCLVQWKPQLANLLNTLAFQIWVVLIQSISVWIAKNCRDRACLFPYLTFPMTRGTEHLWDFVFLMEGGSRFPYKMLHEKSHGHFEETTEEYADFLSGWEDQRWPWPSAFPFLNSQHLSISARRGRATFAGAMEGYYSRFDSSDLEKALSEDLAGHSTQGAHGLNYHHGPPGDEGQTFFMPCKSIMGQGGTLTALFQLVQQINGNSPYDSTTFCGIP